MKMANAFIVVAAIGTSMSANISRAQGSPQPITQQRVDVVQLGTGYRASKLTGSAVFNQNRDRLGTIDDLIVVPNNKDSYLVLSVGGFLGMGTHLVAVPFSDIRIVDKQMQLPDATKDSLRSLPEFKYVPS